MFEQFFCNGEDGEGDIDQCLLNFALCLLQFLKNAGHVSNMKNSFLGAPSLRLRRFSRGGDGDGLGLFEQRALHRCGSGGVRARDVEGRGNAVEGVPRHRRRGGHGEEANALLKALKSSSQ